MTCSRSLDRSIAWSLDRSLDRSLVLVLVMDWTASRVPRARQCACAQQRRACRSHTRCMADTPGKGCTQLMHGRRGQWIAPRPLNRSWVARSVAQNAYSRDSTTPGGKRGKKKGKKEKKRRNLPPSIVGLDRSLNIHGRRRARRATPSYNLNSASTARSQDKRSLKRAAAQETNTWTSPWRAKRNAMTSMFYCPSNDECVRTRKTKLLPSNHL